MDYKYFDADSRLLLGGFDQRLDRLAARQYVVDLVLVLLGDRTQDILVDPVGAVQQAKPEHQAKPDLVVEGHEDGLINREAGAFWREMEMRNVINKAVADVEAQYRTGELKWD